MTVRLKYLWTTVLLMLPTLMAVAQRPSDEMSRLTTEMYRYFQMDSLEKFNSVIDQLKQAALKAGDERTFYKAWSNQALYLNTRARKKDALRILGEVHDYARQHDSKYGLYISTTTSANMLSGMKLLDQAEKSYLEAIDYAHRYFPEESAAYSYLGLAKIYQNRHLQDKMVGYARQALKEPNVIPIHRLHALSYVCIGLADKYATQSTPAIQNEFNQAFEEHEKLAQQLRSSDSMGPLVRYYHAKVNGRLSELPQLAQKIKIKTDRLSFLSSAYSFNNDYQQAFHYYSQYVGHIDSLYEADMIRQSSDYATQLDVARAENESKDLKLKNQALALERAATELEQRRLEEEALALSLKSREADLLHAAARQRNDSLDAHNKDLRIREFQSAMEAEVRAEEAQRTWIVMTIAVALLIIGYLSFYLWRRRTQLMKLRDAYGRLEETTAAKERIDSELRVARNIQMAMTPQTFPERADLDIFATTSPAKEVGGDLYDFFLDGSKLYFCVGDVSGKGVPASMTMAVVVNLFRAYVRDGLSPVAIVQRMNEAIALDNESGMFVTMFVGELNLQTGCLDYCNAGHNPPIIASADGAGYLQMEPNAPVGLWDHLQYTGEQIADLRGKTLFVYTDGVNEAENRSQEQFGEERLLALLADHQSASSRQVIEEVREQVRLHVDGAEASDDMTLLCIRQASAHTVSTPRK